MDHAWHRPSHACSSARDHQDQDPGQFRTNPRRGAGPTAVSTGQQGFDCCTTRTPGTRWRQLIDGIRFRVRTGVPWRDVPVEHGPWGRVHDLFRWWQRNGTWQRILPRLQSLADAKGAITWDLSVDSTVCRAHQHAAGARKQADKAYASHKNRAYLRRRGIRCTIPGQADEAGNRRKLGSRGGRSPCDR
ncbi:transposase [Streptomyces sp. NPDC087219]|uniref:transposase n=1 Tax=Streptomyces sp. NPDC087219 TaxID=3365770 RepID=UPI0038025A6D